MQTAEKIDYGTLLQIVNHWPPSQRFIFVQDVLKSLATESRPARAKRHTLPQALGLLVTDKPIPSDAEVQRMLNERRMEKYG